MAPLRETKLKLHVFMVKEQWYWWLIAGNGRAVACCPTGFTRSSNAINAAVDLLGDKFAVVYTVPVQASGTLSYQVFDRHNKSLGDLLLAASSNKAR